MATEVVMPRLSDTMETGTIAKWLKHEGDSVTKGEVLAEIETDKANMELESYANGVLAQISVQEGQSAGVGEPIAVIAANQDEVTQLGNGPRQPEKRQESEHDRMPPDQGPPAAAQTDKTEPNERIKASPLARRMAQERGVDLMDVAGTGPGGRITKEDVESFGKQAAPAGRTEQEAPAQPSAPPEPRRGPSPAPQPAPLGAGGREPQPIEMTRMRRTIATRMTQARFSAPDFLLTAEFDMAEARELLRSIASTEGAPRVGPNDLLVKAAAMTLTQHPNANAGWENDVAVHYGRINVGIAVATPGGGLMVPVIKDADTKSLGQIATEAKALIDKARNNKLAPNEYEGGTFTVSNLGMYGIDQFTSILNPPEACSLAVGAIAPKPVAVDGEIAVRERMRVTLTCDHRVINGAEGAEFLATLRRYVEHPMMVVL